MYYQIWQGSILEFNDSLEVRRKCDMRPNGLARLYLGVVLS